LIRLISEIQIVESKIMKNSVLLWKTLLEENCDTALPLPLSADPKVA